MVLLQVCNRNQRLGRAAKVACRCASGCARGQAPFFAPAGEAWSCRPSTDTTFMIVANSGFPHGDSELSGLDDMRVNAREVRAQGTVRGGFAHGRWPFAC